MQLQKSLRILNGFRSIGIIICLMEAAIDKHMGVKNRQTQKLRDIGLVDVPNILVIVRQLRNAFVHEAYDKIVLHKLLIKISQEEMLSFVVQLAQYLSIDIPYGYFEYTVQTLYAYINED